MSASRRPAAVIVLAAGDGTRMKSDLNKMLHRIGGRTLVAHALLAAARTETAHVAVTVRAQRDRVAPHVSEVWPDAVIADQDEVKGTGRAAECALDALPADLTGTVLVTYGDTPLLTTETLLELTAVHEGAGNAVTVLTAHLEDPTGYGRVYRGHDDTVHGIIEHKDALQARHEGGDLAHALDITEINSGIYAFDVEVLRASLAKVTTDNAQGEKYLTDVLAIARADGGRVDSHSIEDIWQIEGVNDKVQLARMGKELNRRTLDRLMRESGAIVTDPDTTWVDAEVTVGRDTVLEPNTQLLGATSIGAGAIIGPDCTLKDTEVGDGASVVRAHTELAVIGPKATVGPYSYLRPGTTLGEGGKIGGFVETKNADIGAGAKVPHLTYAGDVTIGEGANIGAGTIFANYDGVAKHHTQVGAHSFIGSNSVLVAPVTINDGAYVGAGSAIDGTVGPGQIAVARARQRNVDGWVARRRAGTRTAAAAEAALAARGGENTQDDNTHDTDSTHDTDTKGEGATA
ncbi:bifunctional UDP-N-acetylglucosamine diphosphorylase/glucosamine-1-phosphate N-acetyltransferase GlmU [Luteipulveratus sp. YIM 133132]|uniref:bifunctional UDP-N-acetylglucosamine diphosphorylase/glucosamine-1-phosphate N-acetyltransferase GlmU n=1 Tax=Luteipulveratus flavus TaxID=3031728 RepID=UPI0023AF51EE|nr:bifunctional UDP-N-acetylglucosamine diphosphorylase/glucosamine-1-phosphate N-acetyltransferase GlmU [Luteipulveratus sp. YIM 133132]MDE9364286.1 bifunctional UDP-N-acetylglucosamine diphosphorylase/glucosamine-1-phosphate N-acetyltransferase GlmU [Luteipulveratus sp. YIM 133132]